MIRKEDIKPNYRIISKYIDLELISYNYNPKYKYEYNSDYELFEKFKPEFNRKDFEKFLTDNNLTEHLSELYVFAAHYYGTWRLPNKVPSAEGKLKEGPAYLEFEGLIKFLGENSDCDRITISSPRESYTIKNPLILGPILLNILNEIGGKWIVKDKYDKGQNYLFWKEVWKPFLFNKKAFRKTFTQSLSRLFNYLRNETYFKDEPSNERVYVFIIDFCSVLGIDNLPDELRKYIN